jgi:peptide/nickel transport system permease protein
MSLLRTFILNRVPQYVILIFVVMIVNFTLIHAAPGDPTHILAGEIVDEEFIRSIRAKFKLDRPLYEQLITYILNVIQGDLGYSYHKRIPVATLILERIPATLLLVITAISLAVVIGIVLGVMSAARRGAFDVLVSLASVIGVSLPIFWIGMLLLLIFAVHLDLLPIGGIRDVRADYEGLAYIWDVGRHLVLPAITLAIFHLAFITKLTRSSMLGTLTEDYITTARSKGLSERIVIIRHALRNALFPVITYTGLTTGTLLTGAILTETVFSWPGMGSLLYDALRLRDYPLLMGIFIYGTIIVVVANAIVDILYGILDPRVRVR